MRPIFGNNILNAIGLMSGTSLDGLDITAVQFKKEGEKWTFKLISAITVPYSKDWYQKLKSAHLIQGEELSVLDVGYGKYIGELTNIFVEKLGLLPSFIASHGHTVFHKPNESYTLQIGDGATIAAVTGLPVVADFRAADVALGGQGAPLAPIGDMLLFSEYNYCLNLGGFANISFENNNKRIAFDICPVNIVLNELVEKFGRKYDENGIVGKKGSVDPALLEELNDLEFYLQSEPKSLGREWVEEYFTPILLRSPVEELNKLRTVYEHIAVQIATILNGKGTMLVTGGGAFNTFLLERIQNLTTTKICLPEQKIIEYKEAIIFAFLGLLRLLNLNNCLASVTGASKDHSSGKIFIP